ncbi:ABC transporter permease [Enterocloster asparagiformis]|uniref:ABC transporter permease n=1 Tax=Enterocloster asparagiformis TaxID=333367 RepID=UPI002A80D75C|nr:ABC transporter permease [Enterocloster asparagiformis]
MTEKRKKEQSPALQFIRRFFSRGIIVKVATAIVAAFIVGMIIGPLITPYDPNAINLKEFLSAPSSSHWLGTDVQGRDVVTRILYGARVSMVACFFACLGAGVVGIILGLVAAYWQGSIWEVIIMRYVDFQMSLPAMLITIIAGLFLGYGQVALIIAIGIGYIPSYIRLIYSVVIQLKESDYVVALCLANIKSRQIIFKHLLLNSIPSTIVMFAMNLGKAIMLESTLSFLGIGIQAPQASWGTMVSDGYAYIFRRPVLCLAPGICIALLVISFNIIGDSLRDTLDPRLKGRI